MQTAAITETREPDPVVAPAVSDALVNEGRSATQSDTAGGPATPRQRIKTRLNIYFAIAVCLSGLTLAGNPATEMLPVIACFFAIFGLVFVDLLRWFSLPPTAAYLTLGMIALYSIGRLMDRPTGEGDDLQMVVVAELLVLVQAVLMLQQKNRRIYEQLAIFCLLELIVAAIFNDALSYGLLLFPLGVVGAAALALLQTYHTTEETFATGGDGERGTQGAGGIIRISATRSADSFHRAGLALPWLALTVLTPAVLMVAMLFFYGLPRTNMAAKRSAGRAALVGFSETVRLGQIGQMLQNDALAARIDLTDQRTGKPYVVSGNLYLRGAVLEAYSTDPGNEGTWTANELRTNAVLGQLPAAPDPGDRDLAANELRVQITVESSNRAALFALAPYHQLNTGPSVTHLSDRWLLSRRRGYGLPNTERISYTFATTAFRGGEQTRFLPRFPSPSAGDSVGEEHVLTSEEEALLLQQRQQNRVEAESYARRCLEYDEYRIPAALQLSEALLTSESQKIENPFDIATSLEQFLSYQGGYRYTLNLTGETMPGLDPIEQFLSVDRQGNCQYFASALVLMLRSQGIPARLVVGYNTDEFNTIGGYYAARQLHAHAWVEALIDAQWLPPADLPRFAEADDQYWVRFDPTPGGGGVDRAIGGRVSEVMELAQNMWTDYVVQRDASGSRRDGLAAGGSGVVTSQYRLLFRWIESLAAQIRSGRFGDGAMAIGRQFSSAAVLMIALALLALCVYQLRGYRRRRRSASSAFGSGTIQVPQVAFFAETLKLLERIGIQRSVGQTPLELTTRAAETLRQPGAASLDGPLRLLTDAFYDTRFGGAAGSDSSSMPATHPAVMAALQSLRARVEMIETRARPQPY